MPDGSPAIPVGALLRELDGEFPARVIDRFGDFLRRHAGVRTCAVFLADYDLQTLREIVEITDPPRTWPISDTLEGQAFLSQQPVVDTRDGQVVVAVPVSVRNERLGVLSVTIDGGADSRIVSGLQQAAVLLGYVIPTMARYTDVVERARRDRPLELPAEIQWAALPVRAYEGTEFAVAGQLVPAYEVGGDLFDYAVEEHALHVTVLDAMGHGLRASLLGTLAVNALRNARRTGLDLTHQLSMADRAIFGQFGGDQFVTALSLEIDLTSGDVLLSNAGHPEGHLLRGGSVLPFTAEPQLPLGMFEKSVYVAGRQRLEPGDRLVLISDGVLEATDAAGVEFGEERLHGALLATAHLPSGEVPRALVRLVQEWQGLDLRDDATIVCLDWRGPAP